MGLTADDLRAAFDYDAATGLLKWREDHPYKPIAGKVAGSINNCGYRVVSHRGKIYKAHRIIWCIVTGEWPTLSLDHINGVKDDNRWSNLRLADPSTQTKNQGLRSDNKSGHKGVVWNKQRQRWQASIRSNGQTFFLGLFGHKEDAIAAYKKASLTHHTGCLRDFNEKFLT